VAILLDTNVLVRLANAADAAHSTVACAVLELHRHGETLHIAAQNLVEFRSVATRPLAVNGLGMSAPEAQAKADSFEATFALLPDTPAIFPSWKALVNAAGTTGKQVHDARIVAVCEIYNVTKLMTFDVAHFRPLVALRPHITLLDPTTI
jgi:predicted nucleic acid-binding protein